MASLFLNSCKVEIFSEISEEVFLNYIHNFCLDFQIEKSQIRGKWKFIRSYSSQKADSESA